MFLVTFVPMAAVVRGILDASFTCSHMICSQIARWQNCTRILALLGMLVMTSGRIVHIHECGRQEDQTAQSGYQTCHSCCHLHHATPDSDEEVPLAPEHDHDNCELCSCLAVTPLTLGIVEVPRPREYAEDCVLIRSEVALLRPTDVFRSRGPPAV